MTPDVVVVGGGFAGLSAAVRLTRDGARVLLLESRSRLGGRATAFPDRESGELVDNGQHVLAGCYRETFSFLREIGALDGVTFQRSLDVAMIDRDGHRSRLTASSDLPSPFNVVAGVFDWPALRWVDRLAILRMVTVLRNALREMTGDHAKLAASPGETVTSWLVRNGQTPRLREMLWDPLALATLNQSPDSAAAPVFARVLAEMFGSDRRASTIVIPNTALHLMYAEPARQYIEDHGGVVRTGTAATIRIASGRVVSARADEEEWKRPLVVSAVPWFALPALFEGDTGPLADLLSRARATGASPIVTVNLWFDRAVVGEPFVGLPGRALQWVFERPALSGNGSYQASLVASGAPGLLARTNAQLEEIALVQLLEVLPGARSAKLLGSAVIREPRATFSLAPDQPQRPKTGTAVAGLVLAGDWIDTGLPATIEGAVRSGHMAAAACAH